ncbi:hypothetical protein ACHAXR_002902 [Thalassiosira sp. AJA248-18]
MVTAKSTAPSYWPHPSKSSGVDGLYIAFTENRRSKRAKRKSSKQKNTSDTLSAHIDDNRSISSSSTSSTFSYIKSILERRRHFIVPALPTVHERSDEEGSSNGSHNRKSSRRAAHKHSKRKRKRKSSHRNSRKIHPLMLLVIAGLAANWAANRILHMMFIEDIDLDVGETDATSYKAGSLRNSLGELDQSIGTDSDHINDERLYYDQQPNQLRHRYRNNPSNQTKDIILGDIHIGSEDPSQLTKRFVALRRRLLSLYSETIPSETPQSNSSKTVHPLFNTRSPQYQALFWLANIDKLQLRHYDGGLIQRYVLAVIYFSTGGPFVDEDTDLSQKRKGAWRNPTNFLAPTHECEWKSRVIDGAGRGGGIRRCDKNKTVVEISIYNELSGTIPTEIGRLWNLRTLYLGRNKIAGSIPTELGMIQKLSSLSLQWNDLSGTIPQYHLQNLKSLRALQLEGNEKLSGNLHQHSLLCQMRNKYSGYITPKDQERYTGRRLLRVLTATCIPSGTSLGGVSDRLECACCTECFGKSPKDLIYHL